MKKQHSKGFTLVEVLIVIVILGILAVIAVPKLTGATAKAKTAEIPMAAGSYIKLQDAYIAEHAHLSNWRKIGYTAPGNRGTSSYFQYSEGNLYDNATELDKLGNGKIGWQATNISSLIDCAVGSWWTVKVVNLAGGYVGYQSQVNSPNCVKVSGSFENGNTVGSGDLTPGGISNVIAEVSNTTTNFNKALGGGTANSGGTNGASSNNTAGSVTNVAANYNSGSNDNSIGTTSNTASNSTTNSTTNSSGTPGKGSLLEAIQNMIGLIGSSSSAADSATGTTDVVAAENTSDEGTASGSTGGSVGGSVGGSTGGSTTGSVTEGTTNATSEGEKLAESQEQAVDSTETKDTVATESRDLIEGTMAVKAGGWNGDGYRNSTDKDKGMVNLKDAITAGVLYTYNTGETEPGKEGLYKLDANSTYTFTVSDADVSWGKNDWLQTEIRVFTESNFSAKGSSSGPAAVMCGTTQNADALKNWDKSIWSTTGENTSSNPRGFTATGTYDKATGVTTFTINTGNEASYFGANFRMNGAHGALGNASETVQNEVKTAIQNSTLVKN